MQPQRPAMQPQRPAMTYRNGRNAATTAGSDVPQRQAILYGEYIRITCVIFAADTKNPGPLLQTGPGTI